MTTDKRKQSLYFPEHMLGSIQKEADRLDRSLSWIVQRCVRVGLPELRKLPSTEEPPRPSPPSPPTDGSPADGSPADGSPADRRPGDNNP